MYIILYMSKPVPRKQDIMSNKEYDQCPCDFDFRFHLSDTQLDGLSFFFAMLIPLIVSINLMVVIMIIKVKDLSPRANRFYLAISLSDICLGITGVPLLTSALTTYRNTKSCMVEGLGIFFSLLFTHISGFNICSIAIERYIHIRYPLRWSQILTNTRLNALLIFNAVYSLMIASTFSAVFYGQFVTINALVTVLDTIIVGVTYTVYLKSYFMMYNKVKSRQEQSEVISQNRDQSAPEYLPYVAKTVFLILFALFLFYLPYMFVILFIAVKTKLLRQKLSQEIKFLYIFSHGNAFINSIVNALIFLMRNRVVKRILRRKIRNYFARFTSSQSN